jgi:hypothetical protein
MQLMSEKELKLASGGCIKFGPEWTYARKGMTCSEIREHCVSSTEKKCEKVNAAAPFQPIKKK